MTMLLFYTLAQLVQEIILTIGQYNLEYPC